ncbi:MAG: APC family permease [Bacteroidales bacterium]|nr:APC family permease [Bacteroidales bacterium]
MGSTKIKKIKLKELASTAICGNDISSSVLYVSALSIIYAGQYAWITLLIVAFVLFLFRKIYTEVVGALPLNGGAYNALLNTTSKSMASFAATLTLLSYMATAVISANEGMHYLHSLIPSLNVIIATIVLLAIFAGLTISGITESSKVAVGIFLFHLSSMFILIIFVFLYLSQNGFSVFLENWHTNLKGGSILMAIFFGFSASMLGISGFESSANFVEEQEKGVFPKTLRNMWIVVSILNPLMAFLALSLVPLHEVKELYANTLLSHMAEISAKSWLSYVISIDAVLVLSGAVLTSFIGVSGLLERLTLDRIMPNYFLKKNKKGSSYRIIIFFFLLSVSILLITEGNVKSLAGVYTISFLSVMALFVIGNVFLKVRRAGLPRPVNAGWLSLFVAFSAVITAIVGNILIKPDDPNQSSNFTVFLDYFIPTVLFVAFMLNRTLIMKFLLNFIHFLFDPIRKFVIRIDRYLLKTIDEIRSQEFVFFTKGDNIANLNKAMIYICKNEHTKKLKIVNINDTGKRSKDLKSDLEFLRREYPDITIEFVIIKGKFEPKLIQELSIKWNIPVNFMFMGSPGDKFPYRIEELGGVRLII